MLNEEFTSRYTTIPLATYSRDYSDTVFRKDLQTLTHMHKQIEILIVLKGNATVYIDQKALELHSGNVIVIPPYHLHHYRIPADSGFYHQCICFDTDMLHPTNLKSKFETGSVTIRNFIQDSPSLFNCIHNIVQAESRKQDGWELFVLGNLFLFFSTLMQNREIVQTEGIPKKPLHHHIMKFISKNYGQAITSADVAKELHISSSYFCRLFHRDFRSQFQNYLNAYRIERACVLLQTTSLPITEIASNVGFNSPSYFGKLFREQTGYTPKQYRCIQN